MITNIKNELKSYLNSAPLAVQQILFTTQAGHPVWEDSLEVLQMANQQLMIPLGVIPDEHILAFVGAHAKVAITGKRNSIGFLITNFRILTQSDFSVIGKPQDAQINLFTQNQNPKELTDKIWGSFFAKGALTIPQEQLVAIQQTFEKVVEIALPQLQQMNFLPKEVEKSTYIMDRIRDLGLQNVLETYAKDEKMLKKFAAKHNISDIIVGVVDKPLFGGVYGLVITRKGITSRDLMEDSITSSWDDIKKYPAIQGDKKDVIVAGHENHFIPEYQKEYLPSIVVLINELANGEVSI